MHINIHVCDLHVCTSCPIYLFPSVFFFFFFVQDVVPGFLQQLPEGGDL